MQQLRPLCIRHLMYTGFMAKGYFTFIVFVIWQKLQQHHECSMEKLKLISAFMLTKALRQLSNYCPTGRLSMKNLVCQKSFRLTLIGTGKGSWIFFSVEHLSNISKLFFWEIDKSLDHFDSCINPFFSGSGQSGQYFFCFQFAIHRNKQLSM